MTPEFWYTLKKKINAYRIKTISDDGVISDDATKLISMLENYIQSTPVSSIKDLPKTFDPIIKG
jgi:hypothetical protein